MNLIYKYYANILGLIRFLGIGVGNEDSRASSIFTIIVVLFLTIIMKYIGFDVLSVNSFVLVVIVLSIFFLTYTTFSKQTIKNEIVNWLETKTLKERLTSIIFSFVLTISVIIIFFKLYG